MKSHHGKNATLTIVLKSTIDFIHDRLGGHCFGSNTLQHRPSPAQIQTNSTQLERVIEPSQN